MFDVGFFELMLIGVVALVVVGPERLPRIARTAGLWLGKGRQFVNSVKSDIEQEIKADELKRILEEQKRANPLHEILEDTRRDFAEIKSKTAAAVTTKSTAPNSPPGQPDAPATAKPDDKPTNS